MAGDFSRSLLRVALAQVCQSLGWNAVQSSPMEILTDVLEKYIVEMGKYAHRYSEQFGRTEPNLDDLGLSFVEMGVDLHELVDYVKHVDPIPFALDVPKYPVKKPHHLNFPKPNSRELAEREEHVDDHLPTMHPGWDVEVLHPSGSGVNDELGERDVDEYLPGDKRPVAVTGSGDEGSPSKKHRILPDEAAPSNYTMKGVTMSNTGSIVGEGKLPDANAPPPPTPTTPMITRPPLFKTPSSSSLVSEPAVNVEPSIAPLSEAPVISSPPVTEKPVVIKDEAKPEIASVRSVDVKPQSPRARNKSPKGERFKFKKSPGRKSPAHSPGRSPGRPKSKSPARSPGRPKSPGRSPIMSPKSPVMLSPVSSPPSKSPAVGRGKSSGRSPGRPPKSPGVVGRPPKSPGIVGRPPKSPGLVGRPPKSPGIVGRPPKSPGIVGRPPKSPGVVGRPPKSPGRPPKSPGRPPKSPGPGRPKKSPGRPPKSPIKQGRGRPRKDSHISQNPIKEYLMTGEPPIGEKPPTKAQLKSPPPMPIGTFPQPYFPTAMQGFDFGSPSSSSKPSGVITETVSEITTTTEKSLNVEEESSPPMQTAKVKPPHKIQTQKSETKSRGRGRPSKKSLAVSAALDLSLTGPKRDEEFENIGTGKVDIHNDDNSSGRITPDWIKKRQDEIKLMQKEKDEKDKEDKDVVNPVAEPSTYVDFDEPPRLSPITPLVAERAASPKPRDEEKIKKKEKKREKENESEKEVKTGKRSKKEEKKLKKLREKLLAFKTSPTSSPDVKESVSKEKTKAFEFPSLSDTPKPHREQPTIQPIRIGFGSGKEKTKFTIKLTEDSDKSDKEHKKKKKKKEKERLRDEKTEKREKSKDREKKKKEKKEKREDKKEVPKLKIKFGRGSGSVSDTPKNSPKYETDSKISSKPDRPITPQMLPSTGHSPSPTKTESPLPPKLNSPLHLSPVRFTPSPDSASMPKTPSFGIDSPLQSRSPSPDVPMSRAYRDRSPSPVRTPAPSSPPTPRPPTISPSPSPPPPEKPKEVPEDVGPPPPPSSAAAKGKGGVFAETQGTIINENGEIIWICPACKMPDDGSPMIGCDVCDDWYHWPCVKVTEEPPEDESWYCPKHVSGVVKTPPKKSAATPAKRGRGRGRGRKKKV